MTETKEKYTKTMTVRLPLKVYQALKKKVHVKNKDFPRYKEADAIRSAIVNDLKAKGYLDKKEDYL